VIEKELRALLPAWTACAVALVASARGVYPLNYLGVPAYLIGMAALGAFAMGHEYAYGTVGLVLALPVPRWRIWTAKMAVLLPMVAALTVLATFAVHLDTGDRTFGAALFLLPALAALFIAPWLTMVSRSALAGTIFTMSIVGGSMAFGEWIGIVRHAVTKEVDAFRVAFLWWTVGGLSLVGAIAGWRTFARLEMADARGADVDLLAVRPAGAASTTVRRAHPLVALVWKELRLQQLAFVVAAFYTVSILAVALLRAGDTTIDIASVLSTFYMLFMPALTGSLAGGEERQFATHDSQLLLPVKASTQWIVKTAIAIGLSYTLAVLLPFVLTRWMPMRVWISGPVGLFTPQVLVATLGYGAISLYVSTLARSGVSALMYSIGAIVGVGYFTIRIALGLVDEAFLRTRQLTQLTGGHAGGHPPPHSDMIWALPLGGFVLVVLWLALTNYRYEDRGPTRVVLHAAVVLALIAVSAVTMGVVSAL